jgi:tetratricopeptide (TPR) repeat protein
MKMLFITFMIVVLVKLSFCQETKQIDDARLLEYYQDQHYADALTYLKTSFPEPITDVKALSRLAYTSQLANKLSDAEAYYQRAYNIDTTNRTILFNMAAINMRRGNIPTAELYYKHILLNDTTNFTVYSQLASISQGRNDTINTINYLQKANQLNPADVNTATDLADILTTQKQFDKAAALLNKAAESDPENVIILLSTAKLFYTEKKWAQTVEVCEKLKRMQAAHGEIITKLGISYYNLNNFACGAETFASLGSLEQSEYTYYYAALCYKGLKDEPNAIAFMNKAISEGISPNIASYYGEIAESEEKRSRHRSAANAYLKGLQFSETPTIYYLLANLYDTQLKDKKNAVKYYKKYLASKPPAKQQTYIAFTKSRLEQLRY